MLERKLPSTEGGNIKFHPVVLDYNWRYQNKSTILNRGIKMDMGISTYSLLKKQWYISIVDKDSEPILHLNMILNQKETFPWNKNDFRARIGKVHSDARRSYWARKQGSAKRIIEMCQKDAGYNMRLPPFKSQTICLLK